MSTIPIRTRTRPDLIAHELRTLLENQAGPSDDAEALMARLRLYETGVDDPIAATLVRYILQVWGRTYEEIAQTMCHDFGLDSTINQH